MFSIVKVINRMLNGSTGSTLFKPNGRLGFVFCKNKIQHQNVSAYVSLQLYWSLRGHNILKGKIQ